MTNQSTSFQDTSASYRLAIMQACAHATVAEMKAALQFIGFAQPVEDVRPPESGLVMLRGRVGGAGSAFNVGEASVTRAVVQFSDGTLGYSYLLGRSTEKARLAAILDGLGQQASLGEQLNRNFVAGVLRRVNDEQRRRREEAAATRVDFFTLVRGEDA
jgi:alpha-D-ribose 1-methylphosphonate 5-triphosphate synthase subunit PhnG